MKFIVLLLVASLFKQVAEPKPDSTNYHPFLEVIDSLNVPHYYQEMPHVDGTYYCWKHEILEDLRVIKKS